MQRWIGTLVGVALRVGDRVNVQPAVSLLLLVAVGRSGASHIGVARVWETAIGAGVTLFVSVLLWPPHPVNELRFRPSISRYGAKTFRLQSKGKL